VPAVTRLRTGAVRLAAAAPRLVDAAGTEIAGPGQPRVQLRALAFQLVKRLLSHPGSSGSVNTSRLPGQPGLPQHPYKCVAHPLLFPDAIADAIVDAETGCLLRLISYVGDALAVWRELDDISTEPAGPDEFRVDVPPGTRVVEETGNLIADDIAVMPGVTGTAARAAAEAVNRTTGAVSAARSFLDNLRRHR
jgi:hypothetical protein